MYIYTNIFIKKRINMKLLHKLFIFFLIFFLCILLITEDQQPTNTIPITDIQEDKNISVYFCPEDDCLSVILKLIEDANESIFCSVYDISSLDVYHALSSKDINIMIVTDLERSKSKNSVVGLLKSNNIKIITNFLEKDLMHNKFCVFDNKITFVGSMNLTDNCLYKNNNNLLVIKDKQTSSFFTNKINNYFQGNFENSKEEYLQKNLNIFFCPEANCKQKILTVFKNVTTSLDCMYFTFTLKDALYELEDNPNYNNIQKRYVLEKRTISSYSVYDYLQEKNQSVILDKNNKTMHNKFCVVDDRFVVTGSLNLTNKAFSNQETIVFLYDQEIVMAYKQYFEKYWLLWKN